MKKIILSIAVMACLMSQINAQVKFGIKGGLTFDNFKLKDAPTVSFDNAVGWQAGILLQAKIPVIGLGVQPELLYTVNKANVEKIGGSSESNSIHYFEVPLNVRLGLNLLLIRPYLLGGPYFGYALKTEGSVFKSDINKFDWGIGLGGGVEIWKLQLGARYSWGLQEVSKAPDFKMKNNTFSLSLGILF